jgi:hypothetical protein
MDRGAQKQKKQHCPSVLLLTQTKSSVVKLNSDGSTEEQAETSGFPEPHRESD